MELDDFIKNFAEQFYSTDVEMGGGTAYKELEEWSSMTALAVIAMVDDCYGKTLSAADIKNSATIEDLFNIVKSK